MLKQQIDIVKQTIINFCKEFINHPYLCYTEHGQHALFYSMLLQALPVSERYAYWQDKKVCVVQKEYPTAGKLGKPQRQHWDIALLKTPLMSIKTDSNSFDYLNLLAVVEFGMNEAAEHLIDDIARLDHEEAHVDHGFIVHLYRLSQPGNRFSNRDWSPNSPRILSVEKVKQISSGKPIEIIYALVDDTGQHQSGIWSINQGKMTVLY